MAKPKRMRGKLLQSEPVSLVRLRMGLPLFPGQLPLPLGVGVINYHECEKDGGASGIYGLSAVREVLSGRTKPELAR